MLLANDEEHGWEPWVSDGTEAGTALLADLTPGPIGGAVGKEILVVPEVGQALFAASDGVHGLELCSTDGTAAGTWMLQYIWPGTGSSNPHSLSRSGDYVVFVADDGVHGPEIWSFPWTALAVP